MAANTLVDVLRHIAHVRAKQSDPTDETFVALARMQEINPILRYMQNGSPAAPPKEEVERDLHLESGLPHNTVLDLLQCETMMSTMWTLPDFHLLAGPVSMRARPSGGFHVHKADIPAISSTSGPFLEWDGSGSLEAVIDSLVTPIADTHGRCKPYLSACPDIIQVTVRSVKDDLRPPRELDMWVGDFTTSGVYYHKRYIQHYFLVGVVSINRDGMHTSSFCEPLGYDLGMDRIPRQKDPSTLIIEKETSGLLIYGASAPNITKLSVIQSDQRPFQRDPKDPAGVGAFLRAFAHVSKDTPAGAPQDDRATQHRGNGTPMYRDRESVDGPNDGKRASQGKSPRIRTS
ncbi:unnamed protein product [Clonostachys rosea]|uniref:Uncharacterized protein n=1 Tax=Bionectria ochroleuca TaxID=29856 RepID=A0ABY6TY48_BIOOC|nr:unnamed protein product [Clonostachys rosea]